VRVDRHDVVLVGRPVEAGHTNHFAAAGTPDHDVVAALADELVEAAVTKEDIVPVDAVMGEDFVEVVAGSTVEGAGLDPVVAFVAADALGILVAVDEVVARPGKHFRAHVGAKENEVLAVIAHHQIKARSSMDHVMALPCLDIVVATHVADDVVAVATVYDVVAEPALEDVVAAIAVKRVITDAGDKHIIALGTSEYDVLVTRVLEIV